MKIIAGTKSLRGLKTWSMSSADRWQGDRVDMMGSDDLGLELQRMTLCPFNLCNTEGITEHKSCTES